MRPVTMQDIADKAGVTKTTVSLALRGDRRISAAKTAHIREIAEELGYRPNPLVSSLMTQVQAGRPVSAGSTLALLAPHQNEDLANESFFIYCRNIYKGLRARATALGFGVDVIEPSSPRNDFAACARVMRHRGIRGVILPPFMGDQSRFPVDFDRSSFAVVAVGHSQNIERVHRVAHHQFKIAYRLVSECVDRGHRRIGLHLGHDMNRRTGFHYSGAFLGALHDHNDMDLSRGNIFYDGAQRPTELLDWIKQNRFDALISQFPSDYYVLKSAGLDIPGRMGFALLSTTEAEEFMTGCFHDPLVLASAAVDLVTAHLQRNEVGVPDNPKLVQTPEVWIEGATLRPRP